MSDTDLVMGAGEAEGDVRWLSANPAKAWSERWFLLYSPCWMLAMGLVMLSGLDEHLGDLGFVVLALVLGQAAQVAILLLLLPAQSHQDQELPLSRVSISL